jgi:uncharacterized protein DUF2516
MALAAQVNFAYPIITWVQLVIELVVVVVECAAFINCLTQRAEAFPVVGSIPKGGWLAITFGALVLTLLLTPTGIFGMVAVAAALVYLLDVRPALRDAVDGHGSW